MSEWSKQIKMSKLLRKNQKKILIGTNNYPNIGHPKIVYLKITIAVIHNPLHPLHSINLKPNVVINIHRFDSPPGVLLLGNILLHISRYMYCGLKPSTFIMYYNENKQASSGPHHVILTNRKHWFVPICISSSGNV